MKCQVTSSTTHDVLISKEISYKSYKEICSGEPKKVNLGYNFLFNNFEVKNNSLVHVPRKLDNYIHGIFSSMPRQWEVFSMFFSIHNVEPNFLDCNWSWGWYDEELGGWTGCMGKVWGTEYWMWWLSQIIRLRGTRQIWLLTQTTAVTRDGEK